MAARGLDITGLPYVVNAEVPLSEEAYLHRSGRTGRMGNEGIVITLVQDNNLRDLKRLLRPSNITLEEIFYTEVSCKLSSQPKKMQLLQ